MGSSLRKEGRSYPLTVKIIQSNGNLREIPLNPMALTVVHTGECGTRVYL